MNELSTKCFRLVMMDGSTILLDEKEAQIVKESIKDGDKYLEIEDSLILTTHILKVIGDEAYQETEHRKRGDWFCESGSHWVPKGKQCGLHQA
jgi:hypothetical protein